MRTSKIYSFTGIIIFTFICALSILVYAQDDPYRVETFSLKEAGKLKVKTSGGYITVKGSETNEVRVEMYVREDGENLSPNDTELSEFDIEISKSGNRVKAIAENEDNEWWKFWNDNDISISFVVYTPHKMSTNLQTSGEYIEVSGLTGSQKISTSGGYLRLTQLEGTVLAKTSGGHIMIKQVKGNIKAHTSGGRIDAEDVKGTLKVHTSGGSIDLREIHGTVKATTSGGSIHADIDEVGRFVKLKTSGGSIFITVPKGIGLDLDLNGSSVRSEVDIVAGQYVTDEVETSINGGGPEISARTSGGMVHISFE